MRAFRVYILGSRDGTLHIGVSDDLVANPRPGVLRLLYAEDAPDVFSAIARERQLKRWSRSRKAQLIALNNPSWKDLTARSRARPPCRRA